MLKMGLIALLGLGWMGAMAQQPAPQSPAYTLHASSRVVLTDVVVTDRDGNPVHGLTEKDFRLLDNKVPQTLSSFEEHSAAMLEPVKVMQTKPGVFSNEMSMHLPPVVNVLLLDSSNLGFGEQAYLYVELKRFLEKFPAGQPLAIFLRTGPECLLLQDFTADRTLLMAAVKTGIPRLRNPDASDRFRTNDLGALHQMALLLAPVPGRKNLVWFQGGSALVLDPDGAVNVDMRPVYDELEADRISVYPVDARGLTIGGGVVQQTQHMLMGDVAEATGGKAYYNNNGLDEITAKVLEIDRNYYTLTYTPRDFTYDGKWHAVKVELGGGYQLSYRRGYFADAVNTGVKPEAGAMRTRLLVDGSRLKVPAETSTPIVFEAKVAPGEVVTVKDGALGAPTTAPRWGKKRVKVTYTVHASSFMVRQVDGLPKIEVGTAAVMLNREGRQVGQRVDQFTVTINPQSLQQSPNGTVRVSQEIDAGSGEHYLYLLVWDPITSRRGFLEVPIRVPVPAQPAPADGKGME